MLPVVARHDALHLKSDAMKSSKATDPPQAAIEEIAELSAPQAADGADASLYDPLESKGRDLRRAIPGVIRRAHADAGSF